MIKPWSKFYEGIDIDPDKEYIEDCISHVSDLTEVTIIPCWYSRDIISDNLWGVHPTNLRKRSFSIKKLTYIEGKNKRAPFPGFLIDIDPNGLLRSDVYIDEKNNQNNGFTTSINHRSFKEVSEFFKKKYEFYLEIYQLEIRLKSRFDHVQMIMSKDLNAIRFHVLYN